MDVQLRGHHLLCLLGYRGMGYSASYAANMSRVFNRLLDNPDTRISLVEGPDDLCSCFPADAEPHCENAAVMERDAAVLRLLGLEIGGSLPWSSILERIRTNVAPEAVGVLCRSCQWRSYGVCEEGIRLIRSGKELPPLP